MTAFKQQQRSALADGILVLLFIALLDVRVSETRTSDTMRAELWPAGALIGRHMTSFTGRSVRAFLGIPYAKPPVGERRFKPPEPFGPWTGERLAIADGPKCIQRDPYRRDMQIEGSEDCLYLNVYAPEATTSTPLPVMIWFHGGGWQCGAGTSAFYGPDFLMDHDVVLVSANFRLGPLGFLSTETLDCPGNYGLKDQLEVLRWVQAHIAAFGGDPKAVTLFGESAGGASATYMMHIPQAKGFFHKVIAQSGTYFNPWAQPAYTGIAAKRARKVATLLGCSAEHMEPSWPAVLDCLRAKPAVDVVATLYHLFEWDFDPMIPFPPVLEPQHAGALLTALPRSTEPHGHALPLMIGITSDEGLLRTAPLLNAPDLLEEFRHNFHRLLPTILYYDHHSTAVQAEITAKLENFYFENGHNYDQKNHQNLTDVMSDGWFIAGIDEYLRSRFKHQASSRAAATYVYLFEHKGSASFSEVFQGGRENYYGACHAEELQYLFPVGRDLFVSAIPTKNDVKVREALNSMWVHFANSSSPTPSHSRLPHWQPATAYPVHFARIGAKMDSNWTLLRNDYALYQDRVNFWHKLQPYLTGSKQQQEKTEL